MVEPPQKPRAKVSLSHSDAGALEKGEGLLTFSGGCCSLDESVGLQK